MEGCDYQAGPIVTPREKHYPRETRYQRGGDAESSGGDADEFVMPNLSALSAASASEPTVNRWICSSTARARACSCLQDVLGRHTVSISGTV